MKGLLLLFTIWSSVDITLSDVRTIVHNIGTIDVTPSNGKTYYIICEGVCKIEEVIVTLSNGRMDFIGYYGAGHDTNIFTPTFCYPELRSGSLSYLFITRTIRTCVMLKNTELVNARIEITAHTKCDNVKLTVTGNVWRISDIPMQVVTQYIGTISKNGARFYTFVCEGEDGICDLERISATLNEGGHVQLWGWCQTKKNLPRIFCLGSDKEKTTLQTCPWTNDEKKGKALRKAFVTVKATKDSENVVLNVIAYKNLKGMKPGRIL